MTIVIVAIAVAALWLYLVLGHGRFWLGSQRDDRDAPALPAVPPTVVAVIPARNEAETVAETVGSLLCQDYPGTFRIVLVDDQSNDGTGDLARQAADRAGAAERLDRKSVV